MSKVCPVCGKPLGRNKNACSMACYSELRSHKKICTVCGKEFPCPPANLNVTCSPGCSKENRKRLAAAGVNNAALEKAHERLPTHPLTGRFETHINAKEWVIQDPAGNVHKCRNLLLWLREHEDMLDGTPRQAWDGLTKIKYSMQGKRKNKLYQWKGWRLIDYGD